MKNPFNFHVARQCLNFPGIHEHCFIIGIGFLKWKLALTFSAQQEPKDA